jgi:hypothetical protein
VASKDVSGANFPGWGSDAFWRRFLANRSRRGTAASLLDTADFGLEIEFLGEKAAQTLEAMENVFTSARHRISTNVRDDSNVDRDGLNPTLKSKMRQDGHRVPCRVRALHLPGNDLENCVCRTLAMGILTPCRDAPDSYFQPIAKRPIRKPERQILRTG